MREISSTSISIYDIVKYISRRWVFYVLGAVLGALIAYGIARINEVYSALTIVNVHRSSETTPNIFDNTEHHDVPLDLISWRETQIQLVKFMQELVKDKTPSNSLLREAAIPMVSTGWWTHHVEPVKFLPPDQAKEFLAINSMIIGSSKNTDEKPQLKFLARAISEATRISQLWIRTWGKDRDATLEQAKIAADATVNALAMLRYRRLIESISADVWSTDTKILVDAEELNLKLNILENRRRKLLILREEFPDQHINTVAVADELLINYLPITTQLIANSIDIDNITEQLASNKLKQQRNELLKSFVEESMLILSYQFDANELIKQLLQIEIAQREKISKDDYNRLFVMDALRTQLISSQKINDSLIIDVPVHIAQAPTPYKAAEKGAWMGLALALLLSVLWSIFKHARATDRLGRD